MNHKRFTETQILDRLWYFATNGVQADAVPVASACYLLSRGPDDIAVITSWSRILTQFAVLFRSAYPAGLRIPIPASNSPQDMICFRPAFVEVLLIWKDAKRHVLGFPPDPTCNLNTPSRPSAPRSTSRRLIGGSEGEPNVTDDEQVDAVQQIDSASETPQSQPRATAPAFFPEVVVRPAKLTREQSAAPSLINPTVLESAEREAADADALLAEMLGAAATQSNPNDPNLS